MEYGKNGRQFDMRFGSASKISVSPLQQQQQHPDLISDKREAQDGQGRGRVLLVFDSISFALCGGGRAAADME